MSRFSDVGREAMRAAQRELLARYIRHYRGALTAVARELRMGTNSSPVARAVRDLGLEDVLAEARKQPGPPTAGEVYDATDDFPL